MTDAIVISSIVFGIVFFAVWLVRPDLRAWIERPKYRFQKNVRSYDEEGDNLTHPPASERRETF